MTAPNRPLRAWILPSLLALAVTPASAQPPQRPPTPNDTLKSTEIGPDKTVTFRIYAPKASEVTLSGDFGAGGKLTRDEQGVWSLTTGPLTPDYYTYTFQVDGVRTIDPKNTELKPGIGSLENLLLVPGPEAEFEATRDVPHGEVRAAWYHSRTLDTERRMHVYTPPGYERGSDRYPVLYLLHGGGDDDAGWTTVGRASFILDNLIAAGKAVPMIVVMPNGSLPRPANFPRFERGKVPSPEDLAVFAAFEQKFVDELTKAVIPFVEATYRVKADRDHRALAGLSMGGGQTLLTFMAGPERFAYVAVWSAGLFREKPEGWEKRHEEFLASAERINQGVKLLSVRVGDKDFLLAGTKALDEVLAKHGVRHVTTISGGGHTWINWRHYLHDLAAELFR